MPRIPRRRRRRRYEPLAERVRVNLTPERICGLPPNFYSPRGVRARSHGPRLIPSRKKLITMRDRLDRFAVFSKWIGNFSTRLRLILLMLKIGIEAPLKVTFLDINQRIPLARYDTIIVSLVTDFDGFFNSEIFIPP